MRFKRYFFLKKFFKTYRQIGIWNSYIVEVFFENFKKHLFYELWQLNITSLRLYFWWCAEAQATVAVRHDLPLLGKSANSVYKYQVAPDTAMTVRTIMILLYAASRKPRRGEIPVQRLASRYLMKSHIALSIRRGSWGQILRKSYIAAFAGQL